MAEIRLKLSKEELIALTDELKEAPTVPVQELRIGKQLIRSIDKGIDVSFYEEKKSVSTSKITLTDKKGNFSLRIDDQEIRGVTAYKLVRLATDPVAELTVSISSDVIEIDADIEL
jgi:hypothetical protein